MNLARSIQNSATQQSEFVYNTAKNETVDAGENYQTEMIYLYELINNAGSTLGGVKREQRI